jgi:hypothetical protein
MDSNIYRTIFEILIYGGLEQKEIKKIRTYSVAFLSSAIAGGLSWAFTGPSGDLSASTFPDLLFISIAFLLISVILTLSPVIVLTQIISAVLSLSGLLLLYISVILTFREFLSDPVFVIASLTAGGLTLWVVANFVLSVRGIVKFARESIRVQYSSNDV